LNDTPSAIIGCVFCELRDYRVETRNTLPYLYRSLSAKEPIIGGSSTENDLQLKMRQRMPYLYRSLSAKEPYNWWLFYGK